MAIIFIRSIIIFILLLVVMRLMGKRQIGEMQPFEFIITLLIAELACAPMADTSLPLTYGMVSVIAVFVIHQIVSVIEQSGRMAKKILSGKPSLIINKDGVDLNELKKNNLDVEDLIESLRISGYFALENVDYAIFESNGNISVLGNQNSTPDSLPILIINNGKKISCNCKSLNLDENFFDTIKEKASNTDLKSVEVLTLDGNGHCYLKPKGKKFCTFEVKLSDDTTW